MRVTVKKIPFAILAVAIALSLFIGIMPSAGGTIRADVTSLTITGNGVEQEVIIPVGELLDMEMAEQYYSAYNTYPTAKLIKAKGIWLEELLLIAGLKDNAKYIEFRATDGGVFGLSLSHLLGELYYFPNILENSTDDAEPIRPMLAMFFSEDQAGNMTDYDAPRLCFGQAAVSEQTFNDFGKSIIEIEVTTEDTGKYDPPSVSPVPGEVEPGTKVTLSTNGGKGAKIYYTTDGSAPDRNSAIFNLSDFVPNPPITIIGAAGKYITIRAVVYGNLRARSDEAVYIYKISAVSVLVIIISEPRPSQIFYPGSTVTVSGKALDTTETVALTVDAPSGNNVFSRVPLTLDPDGNFSESFALSIETELGFYTVTVKEFGGTGVSESVNFQVRESDEVEPIPNDGTCPDMILTSFDSNGADKSRVIQARIRKGEPQTSLIVMAAVDWNGILNAGGAMGNWTGMVLPASSEKDLDEDHSMLLWRITGLTENTEYVAQVGSNGYWSAPFRFITGKSNSEAPFSFMYLGDVQKGFAQWGKMIGNAYAAYPDMRIGIIGGDLVDDGHANNEWQAFMAYASPVFSRIAMAPIPGNHDDTDLFYGYLADVFPHNSDIGATKNKGYYSFDYGNAHFTMLNSNLLSIPGAGSHAELMAWLQADLQKAAAQEWRFAVMHYPPYPIMAADNYSDSNLRDYWIPVFEQYGVDIVFAGHQHAYARTKPIKNGNIMSDPSEGIVYITGNSGSKHYEAEDYDYIETSASFVSTYQIIEIDNNKLSFKSFDQSGSLVDSFVYTKYSAITSLRINAYPAVIVERGGTYKFELVLNKGASGDGVIWSVQDPALASVGSDGTVTVFNKTGVMALIANDPVSNLAHSVILRIR